MSKIKFDFTDIEAQNKLRKALLDELDGIKVDNELPYQFASGDIREIKFNKDTNKVEVYLQPSEPKQITYSINLKQGE
jgi:hypothetical protein